MGKKILLAMYCTKSSLSGPDTWALRLLRWLRGEGIDARAAILLENIAESECDLHNLLRESGVPTQCRRSENISGDTTWFIEQISQFGPGLFIANNVPSALFAAGNLRSQGLNSVLVVHSDDPIYYKLLKNFVLHEEGSYVNHVVVVSDYLKEKIALIIKGKADVHLIHYGAPDANYLAEWNGGLFHLLYVGRFSKFQKRVDDVAKALCMACSEVEGVIATMIGDGPDRGCVETIVKKHVGGDKITLMGCIPEAEVMKEIPKAHAIVLLSDFEGIPITLMEAMVSGVVPIVSPIRSGIPELVMDNCTGMIVKDRTTSFVNAVRFMKENPECWRKMSEAASRHIQTNYSKKKVLAAWSSLVKETVYAISPVKVLRFPVSSWLDFWVDGSMAKGVNAYGLRMQKVLWSLWASCPLLVKKFIRSSARITLLYDGFKFTHKVSEE
jgi:colanic acid/amylovoran biosynthesis glycosyltransferase